MYSYYASESSIALHSDQDNYIAIAASNLAEVTVRQRRIAIVLAATGQCCKVVAGHAA